MALERIVFSKYNGEKPHINARFTEMIRVAKDEMPSSSEGGYSSFIEDIGKFRR